MDIPSIVIVSLFCLVPVTVLANGISDMMRNLSGRAAAKAREAGFLARKVEAECRLEELRQSDPLKFPGLLSRQP